MAENEIVELPDGRESWTQPLTGTVGSQMGAERLAEASDEEIAAVVRGLAERWPDEAAHEQAAMSTAMLLSICFCRIINADEAHHTAEGVTIGGEPIGDWEMIVRRTEAPTP